MNSTLVNPDFARSVITMRRILPSLSFGLLISTYLISAIIMGLFHANGSESLGFTIAAFIVPLAIQAGRGALVFFFQLNPARLQQKFSFGILAATLLLLLSLFEAYLVMLPYGISWTVSVSTLMLIGWIIEIMILKETQFTSEMALYSNPEKLNQLKQYHLARRDFLKFMRELEDKSGVAELQEEMVAREKKNQRIGIHKTNNNGIRLGK